MEKKPTLGQKIYNFLLMVTSFDVMVILFYIFQPIVIVIAMVLMVIAGPTAIITLIVFGIGFFAPVLWLIFAGFFAARS